MAAYQTPLLLNLGPTELIIILAIILLLFGGSRLAGLGRSSGRALKEFKEETKGLKAGEQAPTTSTTPPQATGPVPGTADQWPQAPRSDIQDAQATQVSPTYPVNPSSDVRRDA